MLNRVGGKPTERDLQPLNGSFKNGQELTLPSIQLALLLRLMVKVLKEVNAVGTKDAEKRADDLLPEVNAEKVRHAIWVRFQLGQ